MDSVADYPVDRAVELFLEMNQGKVWTDENHNIVTDIELKCLRYPEGWYYECGYFTNRYETSTGFFSVVKMLHPDGSVWDVPYSTRFMDL